MSTAMDWAREEVRIAIRREFIGEMEDGETDDAICAANCLRMALDVYKAFCKQGHSGTTAKITQRLLNRLIDGKPLTPVEDLGEDWKSAGCAADYVMYQHRRMGSLFKKQYSDGHIEFSDTNQVLFCNDTTGDMYMTRVPEELRWMIPPITFPYTPPDRPYVFHVDEWMSDPANGIDTTLYYRLEKPDGASLTIGKYFGEVDGIWKELALEEARRRIRMHMKRVENEQKQKDWEPVRAGVRQDSVGPRILGACDAAEPGRAACGPDSSEEQSMFAD